MAIPEVISVADAAIHLGVSEQRVRTLLRNGTLEGTQVGGSWVTTLDALTTYRSRRRRRPDDVDDRRYSGPPPSGLRTLSFFSGAMGLDLGLEQEGFSTLLACESDRACRQTISMNKPDIALIGDIWRYTTDDILEHAGLQRDEVDLIVGGPPCQAFSTAGARRGFKDDRGNVFLRYIDLILDIRPRFAVIENVRGLLSTPLLHTPHRERGEDWRPSIDETPGSALNQVLQMLRRGGYGVSFNLYNAANFGVPQSRERVIIICSRDGETLPFLRPTHDQTGRFGLPEWETLRTALDGVDQLGCEHIDFPEERLRFYRMLEPGQYWKHLPESLHREALGNSLDSGGGKTGFLRRLAWDRPSCTLVTSPAMPATDICHPEEHRPLSVQEYARIQQFPDDWRFGGSLTDRYRQIGNAVPVGLGRAVGRLLTAHLRGEHTAPPEDFPFSRYRATDHVAWQAAFDARLGTVDTPAAPARRRRAAASAPADAPTLF